MCTASPISCHPAVLEVTLEASQIASVPFCQLQTYQTPKAPGREHNYWKEPQGTCPVSSLTCRATFRKLDAYTRGWLVLWVIHANEQAPQRWEELGQGASQRSPRFFTNELSSDTKRTESQPRLRSFPRYRLSFLTVSVPNASFLPETRVSNTHSFILGEKHWVVL